MIIDSHGNSLLGLFLTHHIFGKHFADPMRRRNGLHVDLGKILRISFGTLGPLPHQFLQFFRRHHHGEAHWRTPVFLLRSICRCAVIALFRRFSFLLILFHQIRIRTLIGRARCAEIHGTNGHSAKQCIRIPAKRAWIHKL